MKPLGATRLIIVPCELDEANAFVEQHHRHLGRVPGHRWSIAVADPTGQVRGVAIVGRPIGAADQDGWTLQILRNATDGHIEAICRWAAGKGIYVPPPGEKIEV